VPNPGQDSAVLAGKGPDPRLFWPGYDQISTSRQGKGGTQSSQPALSPSPFSFADWKREKKNEGEEERESFHLKKKNLMWKFHIRL